MVKFKYASDLHFEQANPAVWPVDLTENAITRGLTSGDPDALILAGDIFSHVDEYSIVLARKLASCLPVFYVPGNHDHWGVHASYLLERLRVLDSIPNFTVLSLHDVVEFNSVKLAGRTLWFKPQPTDIKNTFIDYTYVNNGVDSVNLINKMHTSDVDFLSKAKADIFVTHHLPFSWCIHPRWRNNPAAGSGHDNRFFCTFLDYNEDILGNLPKYWVFGHTHDTIDVTEFECRFLCNPRGTPLGENTSENKEFSFDRYIDIEM